MLPISRPKLHYNNLWWPHIHVHPSQILVCGNLAITQHKLALVVSSSASCLQQFHRYRGYGPGRHLCPLVRPRQWLGIQNILLLHLTHRSETHYIHAVLGDLQRLFLTIPTAANEPRCTGAFRVYTLFMGEMCLLATPPKPSRTWVKSGPEPYTRPPGQDGRCVVARSGRSYTSPPVLSTHPNLHSYTPYLFYSVILIHPPFHPLTYYFFSFTILYDFREMVNSMLMRLMQ